MYEPLFINLHLLKHSQNMRSSKIQVIISLFCFLFVSRVSAQQWGQYTLYATMNGTTAYLIDTNNAVYHQWTFPSNAKTGYSSYLLPGGVLLRSVAKAGNSFTGGPICGQVQKVDWNGNVIWDYVYSTTTYCTHHDICPMPNGNVLLIAYELKTAAEATQAGSSMNITMWPDKIVEIEPVGASGGTVVWEWHAWDHLVQNVDSTKNNYQTSIVNHPELLNINYRTQKDWLHMNGVDYNDSLDQITFSCHNTDEIYVIDHSTTTVEAAGHTGGNSGKGGDLLYRWGNPPAYQAAGSAILDVVHDAHWVNRNCPTCPNGDQLACFNNNGISNNQSAVDYVTPPYSGNTYSITFGSAFLPITYSTRLAGIGHTSNMGGSQQMPNGNTLVTIAIAGYMYEVDANGTLIWSKTASGAVPKAWRYSSCYVTGTAGTPLITVNGATLNSSPGVTYQWYWDSTLISGATSSSFEPGFSGSYQVVVTDEEGCTSAYSLPYVFSATDVSGIVDAGTFQVYPNPTTGILHIEGNASSHSHTVRVTDISGKIMLKETGVETLDLSTLNNGLYFVEIVSESGLSSVHKINLIR
jgi:Arylsulfotransferase (ASST)/Secretion system C-terminal sorting domain